MKMGRIIATLSFLAVPTCLSVAQDAICSVIGLEIQSTLSGVTVEGVSVSASRTSIDIDYTVANSSSSMVYIYSSNLNGPSVEVRIDGHNLTFGTLPLHVSTNTSYDQPSPAFVELPPGGKIELHFTDRHLTPKVRRELRESPSIAVAIGATRRGPEELRRLISVSEQSCAEDSRNVLVRALKTIVSHPLRPAPAHR